MKVVIEIRTPHHSSRDPHHCCDQEKDPFAREFVAQGFTFRDEGWGNEHIWIGHKTVETGSEWLGGQNLPHLPQDTPLECWLADIKLLVPEYLLGTNETAYLFDASGVQLRGMGSGNSYHYNGCMQRGLGISFGGHALRHPWYDPSIRIEFHKHASKFVSDAFRLHTLKRANTEISRNNLDGAKRILSELSSNLHGDLFRS